jgi:hypothetical protein
MDVMGVDHIGFHAPDGGRYVVRVEPSSHETARSRRAADAVAGPLERLHLVAVVLKQLRDVGHSALLAALQPVAVMEEEDPQD